MGRQLLASNKVAWLGAAAVVQSESWKVTEAVQLQPSQLTTGAASINYIY
jgi:hypothetical protein